METFDASVLPDEPAFSSFEGAVSATARTARAERAKSHKHQLKRCSVVDLRYSADTLTIDLDNGQSLHYWLNGGIVEWDVLPTEDIPMPVSGDRLAAPQLVLRFASPPEDVLFDREAIRTHLLGRRISLVSASFACAYFGVDMCETFCLARMVVLDRNLLHVGLA